MWNLEGPALKLGHGLHSTYCIVPTEYIQLLDGPSVELQQKKCDTWLPSVNAAQALNMQLLHSEPHEHTYTTSGQTLT